MHELTPKEMDEPNVDYIVPEGAILPFEIFTVLRHYRSQPVYNPETRQHGRKYSIPAYLAREWLSKYHEA